MNELLPEVGQTGMIPVDMIRPMEGQPRRHFDEQGLRELGESIKAVGQHTAAWVRRLDNGEHGSGHVRYELSAGERRWRACQLVGVAALRCEVRRYTARSDQYLDSVMENFGRKDCTVLETVDAVSQIAEQRYGKDAPIGTARLEEISRVFARSSAWVSQYLRLRRLAPAVRALLEQPQRLPTAVAVALANLDPATQTALAEKIINDELGFREALALVRNLPDGHRVEKRGGGSRRPSDNIGLLQRFIGDARTKARAIEMLPMTAVHAMFEHRRVGEVSAMRNDLSACMDQLRAIDTALESVERNKKKACRQGA